MNTDPIADMLTRIRNALLRRQKITNVPYSRLKHQVATILVEQRFICKVKVKGKGIEKELLLTLVDDKQPTSPITELKRISKPGRRVYSSYREIPLVKSGRGLVIISTNQGLKTGRQARKAQLGGEIVCSIY